MQHGSIVLGFDDLDPDLILEYIIHGLETVILRYFNIFGFRQGIASPYAAVIPKFIEAMLNGKFPTICGDGKQSRDFTFVENVVQANVLTCRAENIAGEVFNIGCGKRTAVNELARIISKLLDQDVKPIYADPRPGDVKHSLAHITKAERLLNHQPKVGIEEGRKRIIQWCIAESGHQSIVYVEKRLFNDGLIFTLVLRRF